MQRWWGCGWGCWRRGPGGQRGTGRLCEGPRRAFRLTAVLGSMTRRMSCSRSDRMTCGHPPRVGSQGEQGWSRRRPAAEAGCLPGPAAAASCGLLRARAAPAQSARPEGPRAGLTANLPLRNTKLLGSFFFAGSWPSVRCVLFFFCGAAGGEGSCSVLGGTIWRALRVRSAPCGSAPSRLLRGATAVAAASGLGFDAPRVADQRRGPAVSLFCRRQRGGRPRWRVGSSCRIANAVARRTKLLRAALNCAQQFSVARSLAAGAVPPAPAWAGAVTRTAPQRSSTWPRRPRQ